MHLSRRPSDYAAVLRCGRLYQEAQGGTGNANAKRANVNTNANPNGSADGKANGKANGSGNSRRTVPNATSGATRLGFGTGGGVASTASAISESTTRSGDPVTISSPSSSDFHFSHDDLNTDPGTGSNPTQTAGGGGGVRSATTVGTRPIVSSPTTSSGPNKPSGLSGPSPRESHSDDDNRIPTGTIAAMTIVISTIIFFGVLIVLFGKRYITRRRERRNQTWGRTANWRDKHSAPASRVTWTSTNISFATVPDDRPSRLTDELGFLTTFPLAETHRDSMSQFVNYQSVVPDTAINNAHSPAALRASITSIPSSTSDGYSQYLVDAPGGLLGSSESRTLFTPPSESFPFLISAPPRHQAGSWSDSESSHTHSRTTSITLATSTNIPPASAMPSDPFIETLRSRLEELVTVETIKRSFEPSRPDELRVSIDDNVKVLQVFGDGWAMVEKIPPFYEALWMAERTSSGPARGIIPVNCWAVEDLPSLFGESIVDVPHVEGVGSV